MHQHINSQIITSYITTMQALQKDTIKKLSSKYGTSQVVHAFKHLLGDQKLGTTLMQNSLYAIKVKLLLQTAHVNYTMENK